MLDVSNMETLISFPSYRLRREATSKVLSFTLRNEKPHIERMNDHADSNPRP